MDHLIILAGRTIIEYYRDIIGKPRIHSLGSWHHITAATYDSITGMWLQDFTLGENIGFASFVSG